MKITTTAILVACLLTGCGSKDSNDAKQCYSPKQNLDDAYADAAMGCACVVDKDASTCRPDSTGRYVALICNEGRWRAVEDGPCWGAVETRPRLFDSLEMWNKLSANEASYWYEEENCLVNALDGQVTRVEVDGGSAQISSRFAIDGGECKSKLNRYENFKAQTFPALYEACAALLDRRGDDVELEFDERGVMQECSYAGDSDCDDNCGEGFFIRNWNFETR